MVNARLKTIWNGMKHRCYSRNLPERTAKYYRDKGIKVCDEWLYSFKYFEEWALENGYADDLTIDRIDPDGNYEPSNCQWVTKEENSRRARMRGEEFEPQKISAAGLEALKRIMDIFDTLSDWNKGYLTGYAERMVDAKFEREMEEERRVKNVREGTPGT